LAAQSQIEPIRPCKWTLALKPALLRVAKMQGRSLTASSYRHVRMIRNCEPIGLFP
jgi:hypothetical protein